MPMRGMSLRLTSTGVKRLAGMLVLMAGLSTLALPVTAAPAPKDSPATPTPPTPQLVADAQVVAPAPGPPPSVDLSTLEAPPAVAPSKAGDELAERRTSTSKTFATGTPGQFETIVSSTAVHHQDASGNWVEIDAKLSAPRDGRRHNRSDGFDLSLAAKANDPALARVSLDAEHSVAFSLEGASSASGTADGAVITYAGVRKDTNLRLTSRPGGLKEDLILASVAAPDRFVFPLGLKGLTASIDKLGDVVYRDEAGTVRARTPHGFMTDSKIDPRSGDPAISYGVDYALIPHGKAGVALEVRANRAWINDPARQFPIYLDPTTAIATGSDDTFVMSGVPADNSGSTELRAGTYNGGANVARSFLHFNGVNPALNGKIINSAELHIQETWSYSCSPRLINVYRSTGGWIGNQMQYFPGAAYDPNPIGQANVAKGWSASCPAGLVTMGVTSAVATWAATPSTNLGLVLAAPNEGDSFAWKKFSSFETGAPPALHVVWSEPAATAPGPPQSAAAYPSNQSALVTWAAPASNGGSPILGYGVWAWTYPGFVAVSFTEACATCTYVGIGGLTNGQQYYFGVYARNAVGWSSGAGTNLATPGPVAPSAPPSATAVAGNQSAAVSWAPSTNNGGAAIDAYGVFAYTYPAYAPVSTTMACGTCTTATVTGLANGQQYAFLVYTHNSAPPSGIWSSSGALTNPVTPVPPTTTTTSSTSTTSTSTTTTTSTTVPGPERPPSPPREFDAEPGSRQATLTWQEPADIGGAAIVDYVVEVIDPPCPDCSGVGDVGNVMTSTVTGLQPGLTYEISVLARNPLEGQPAFTAVLTPDEAPDAPFGVTAEEGPDEGEAVVRWEEPEDNGSFITGYTVYMTPECPDCEDSDVGGTFTETTIRNLAFGENYTFEVVATNAEGDSDPSGASEPPLAINARARVLTWNIVHTEFASVSEIATQILSHDPEIVGINESDEDTSQALASEMSAQSGQTWNVAKFMSNAILTTYQIVPGGVYSQAFADPESDRSVIRANLIDPYSGQLFFVYVTHLSCCNEPVRRSQAVVVEALINDERLAEVGAGRRFRSLLMGDLNEPGAARFVEGEGPFQVDPDPSIDLLDPDPMRDVWEALGFAEPFPRDQFILADSVFNDDAATKPNPIPNPRIPARIDYIMFGSTESGISVEDAYVDKAATEFDQMGEYSLSDHRPVIALLTIRS